MQKKLQKYIDLLIEMAGSDNNYEVIKEELNEVEKEINYKKTELKNIKKSMKDDKYLKENDRIIDENIKIGLENKKQVYQQELDKILKLVNKASVDEEDNHQALTSVISRLKSLNALLDVLQEKLKVVSKDKNLSSFYENMIESNSKEISELEKKKELITKQYDKVREKLDYYGNNRVELEKKLKHLDIRLEDTLEALATPNFYVDELLKKKDENVVDELNKELEDLENHRIMLITDPVYIGNQAIKMVDDGDCTSALSSIKELVTIVKSKPYMNDSKKELNVLLKQTEATLDEFANNIDNNTYLGEDSKIIENRINYLNNELEVINSKITEINNRVIDIDRNIVQNISKELSETENLYHGLKEAYEEYKKIVLTNDDTISPRKKANLQTAYNRKKEEMDLVYNLFEKYQKELENVIMESKKLETVDLLELKSKSENIQDEIEELKKVKANKTKTKDILAMEKDKEKLNKLSLDVDNIKHSLKYDKSADDIYDEIEKIINHNDVEVIDEQPVALEEKEFVNLDDFRIGEETVDEVKPLEEKGEEPIILEPNNNDINVFDNNFSLENFQEVKATEEPQIDSLNIDSSFVPDEKILQVADENLEDTKVFPPRNFGEERYKVINIEELPKKEVNNSVQEQTEILEEPIESLDNISPVLKDNLNDSSEYISFNDILNGDGYNGN